MSDFKIIGLAHGPLLGFQYIDKDKFTFLS